ncbi:hypothetical protein DMUE_5682 [Dictyocoela muelleri]|nr:hypothetical protein DMUE_5682 [Dictyocoela muelleri]
MIIIIIITNIISQKRKKYCNFHKSTSHNDSECRILKRNNKKNDTQKDKTFVVKETVPKIKNIEVDININSSDYKAIIDTGSSENYLPESICTKLSIETQKLPYSRTIELANGKYENISPEAKIEFSLFNDNSIKIYYQFFNSSENSIHDNSRIKNSL